MSLRIAIAKPDWGISGGFELLTEELARRLEAAGHRVRWLQPVVSSLGAKAFGRDLQPVADAAPEFAQFVKLVDVFESLDLHRADLVLSAMPPSYAVRHPRHIALFSHHLRCYYDLSDVMVEARLVGDRDIHRRAEQHVRAIDARFLGSTPLILATSKEVAGRLDRFNGLRHNVEVFDAGLGFRGEFPDPAHDTELRHALCVSRHEFPKRTELFVQAAHHVRDVPMISVGAGGRLGWAKRIDHEMARRVRSSEGSGRELWCTAPPWLDPERETPGAVQFAGHVTADELDRLYRHAICVVAPAFLEDYGLTAIEAMAYGKPLVVCSDGGNLVNFVEHGVNGLIVDPNGPAIAAAIQQLADDPAKAAEMGRAAREFAQSYTWDRTMKQVNAAIDQVMA